MGCGLPSGAHDGHKGLCCGDWMQGLVATIGREEQNKKKKSFEQKCQCTYGRALNILSHDGALQEHNPLLLQ